MEDTEVYRVLGLDEGADPEEVKAAYRYLSKKYHPDRSGDPRSSQRFVKVVKAYKTLHTDSVKDAYLRNPVRSGLGTVAGSDDVFALGSLALSSGDPETRRYATRRLGFSGKKAAYVFLRRALSDSDPAVVEAAVRSIADLSAFQAAGEIAALYARASERVRMSVLDAAEATGEALFHSALELAVREGGLGSIRARKILMEAKLNEKTGA